MASFTTNLQVFGRELIFPASVVYHLEGNLLGHLWRSALDGERGTFGTEREKNWQSAIRTSARKNGGQRSGGLRSTKS